MFTHNLAYRFQSGAVEGFTGTAFSRPMAREHARQKAARKCAALAEPFDPNRLIESAAGISGAELDRIRHDWEISARSFTT